MLVEIEEPVPNGENVLEDNIPNLQTVMNMAFKVYSIDMRSVWQLGISTHRRRATRLHLRCLTHKDHGEDKLFGFLSMQDFIY